MSKRKGLSPKVRFEVFKRDSFKCQYCGRSAPDVMLRADHIEPHPFRILWSMFNIQ